MKVTLANGATTNNFSYETERFRNGIGPFTNDLPLAVGDLVGFHPNYRSAYRDELPADLIVDLVPVVRIEGKPTAK